MYSTAFWKSWPAVYQRLLGAGIGLFLIAQGFLWIANFQSPGPVIEPLRLQQLEVIESPSHHFQKGILPLTIPSDVHLVFEYVFGGPIQPNVIASSLFAFLLLCGIIFLLSVLTTLTRFWFFTGTGLFVLIIVSLRLDTLNLFGLTNAIPLIVVLTVYGLIGYYFVFLRSYISFLKRWMTFASVTLALGIVIVTFARIPAPLSYLAANGLATGTVLTVVFTFMVAHEIVAFFIFGVSRGNQPHKSLQHFLIITAIYLINLGLLYADKKHIVEWDFFPFSLFFLVTVSGVLGLWGFRQREPQYESIVRADPFGVYLFVALAIIGFGTMGYFLASANDPGIQLFQDAILYSHIGYGLIFFVYVIVNFISLLGANQPVYKVLYKPAYMPYFTFRFAGLIATFAFFAYSNWKVSVNQAFASYYNAMGDYQVAQDSGKLAEGYYRRSTYYATRNYHAHYALAQLYSTGGDYEKEKQEYILLADSRPLDLAYLNLSQIYISDNAVPEASRLLKQGLVDFPKNGLLQNALSLVNARLGLRDSALLLANQAGSSTLYEGEAEANVVGFSAKFQLHFPVDSLKAAMDASHAGVKSNLLALAFLQEKAMILEVDPGTDTILTAHGASALNNFLINPLQPVDTSLVSKTVALARRPSNIYFRNFLLSAAAQACYRIGHTARAFKIMHEIAFLGQQPKYYNVLGLWALEKGATENAVLYFDEALRLNGTTSFYNRAVALTETGDLPKAVTAWDSLSRSGDHHVRDLATRMTGLLKATPDQGLRLSDEEKWEYSRHRFSIDQAGEFEQFIGTIGNEGIRARTIVDRTKRLEKTDDTALALAAFGLLKGLQFQDKALYDEILHLSLRFLAKQNQWPALEERLSSEINFEGPFELDKLYFAALLDERAGKKEEAAGKFAWLAQADPFFEDAVVASIRFLNKNGADKVKTYGFLMTALDRNPNSIKLLKAYIVQSAYVGFEESAQDGLDKLKTLLHPKAFLRFIDENPEIFEVSAN